MIGAIGVDIYRHDFNLYPLHYWRSGEAPDRQGINEIRYITGLYDFFDALAADHSHLLIDSCASGGRRLDFEMQRRSLALWRSDLCWEPTAEQCMTYALSLWMPLHGVGSISLQPYDFRSGMGSTFLTRCNRTLRSGRVPPDCSRNTSLSGTSLPGIFIRLHRTV